MAVYDDYIRRKFDLADAADCVVVDHCSASVRKHGVAIKEALFSAPRGQPQLIGVSQLVVQPEWQEKIDRYCDLMGINRAGAKTGWWLASWHENQRA